MIATLLRVLLLLLTLYAVWLTMLYLQQRSMLFPGTGMRLPEPATERIAGSEWITLETSFGPVRAFWIPSTRDDEPARPGPAALYFPGNFESLAGAAIELQALTRLEISLLLIEYPGYGRSAGRPSRDSLGEASLLAFDWLASRPEVDAGRIGAIGRSIGTGPATELALSRPLRSLVLVSPFTAIVDFARSHAAPAFLVRDRFDNRAALREFPGPVLVLHGNADRLIPHAQGAELASIALRGELRTLECGHNDCAFFAPPHLMPIATTLGARQR